MAAFDMDGLATLALDFTDIAQTPTQVQDDMLRAEANMVADAQKRKAAAYGVKDTGELISTISVGKPKGSTGRRMISIEFTGSRRRHGTTTTNAAIAFINEFGKQGQPARPFIRDANESAAEAAVNAAAAVYDNYLKSKNL